MAKKAKKPGKTRAEQIQAWMDATWTPSSKGTGALYLNCRGYHVAVWEDYQHPGEWVWHIKSNKPDDLYEKYSDYRLPSDEKAKRAVLETLADRLGMN